MPVGNNIFELSLCDYRDFLAKQDLCMVMFYDPNDNDTNSASQHFATAARTTKRPNASFAAVNCAVEPHLCKEQDAKTPMFRLFSRGQEVGTIRDFYSFDAAALSKMVEMSPILDKPRGCTIAPPPKPHPKCLETKKKKKKGPSTGCAEGGSFKK